MKRQKKSKGQHSPEARPAHQAADEPQSPFTGEEWPAYVKCSTCGYEGPELRQGERKSIYDADCPQCGNRTLFLYFIFPVGGG